MVDGPVAEQTGLSFGGLLRQLRDEAGLTQDELAEAAQVSQRAISDLERGINRTARKDTAILLAGALGLDGPARELFIAAARGRAPAGEALAAAAREAGTRSAAASRTFLFTDMEGSTALLGRLGDDVYAQVLAGHHALIRSALAAHDGREVDTQGDAFFAVFSSPRGCVAAVLEMQQAIQAHAWPGGEQVRVRMGIHCGEAARTATGLVGLEVHRAARVAAVGYGGQVLVSEAAAVLVRDGLPPGAALADLGVHRLKDLGRPERIFQLHAAGLPAEFPPLRSLGNPALPNNLPGSAVGVHRPGPGGGRGPGAGGVLSPGHLDRGRRVRQDPAGAAGGRRAAGRVRGRGLAGGAGRGHRPGRGGGGHLRRRCGWPPGRAGRRWRPCWMPWRCRMC